MSWQYAVVALVVGVAVFWAVRSLYRTVTGRSNPCAWCDRRGECGRRRPSDDCREDE